MDLLAVNVGRLVDSQIAPPAIPQEIWIVAPLKRALTVGQLQQQVAGAASPVSVCKATAVHVLVGRARAERSEAIRHTK